MTKKLGPVFKNFQDSSLAKEELKRFLNSKPKGADEMSKIDVDIPQSIDNRGIIDFRRDVAIKMTLVGCGNGGSQVVDYMANFRDKSGKPAYNTLAINSNEGDLKSLKNIPVLNRENLNIGGMGKDPVEGLKTLENNEKVRNMMHKFIEEKVNTDDDLVVFFAVLGGGTGTSTIVKLVEEYNKRYNNSSVPKVLAEIAEGIKANVIEEAGFSEEEAEAFAAKTIKANEKTFIEQAEEIHIKRMKNFAIVAFLPDKADAKKKLHVIKDFAEKLWETAKPRYNNKGEAMEQAVSFIMFPDNQYLLNRYDNLSAIEKQKYRNGFDYANQMVADRLHLLNTIPKSSGQYVNLDTADFKKVMLKNAGLLVISDLEASISEVANSEDISKMLIDGLGHSQLHTDVDVFNEGEQDTYQSTIFNVGMNVVIDDSLDIETVVKRYSEGDFLIKARTDIDNKIVISGDIFDGFIRQPNNSNITSYLFYKTDALPKRLTTGLSEEYIEYTKKRKVVQNTGTQIASIEDDSSSSLESLGIDLNSLLFVKKEDEIIETRAVKIAGVEINIPTMDDSFTVKETKKKEPDFNLDEFMKKFK